MTMKQFTGGMVMTSVELAIDGLVASTTEVDETTGPRIIPSDVRQWLARLRLLENVPFAYLVPDALLLPPESIRFFYIDRAWTDALIQGALSVGTVSSADRAQLEKLHPQLRDELDEEERLVRQPPGEKVQQGPAGPISGFVLRSRAVSGWPGLHVRAYKTDAAADNAVLPESDPNRLKTLRMERLAPAVLLVLFDGIPAVVHIEEPRQGIQFGVRLTATGTNTFSATVFARDVTTSTDVEPNVQMPVSFRSAAPGVIEFERTDQDFRNVASTNMGGEMDSAEYALQMIRFPYRQVFGDPEHAPPPISSVFKPKVDLKTLKRDFTEILR
jgi:hypothetical protein